MSFSKELITRLRVFGLNSYEAKLWLALLMKGVATAGELSDLAFVPRSRSYDVLESLERKGFVTMKLGKPIKYIAVPPLEVIERVKKGVKEEAETQSALIESLRKSEVLDELNTLHTKGLEVVEPSDLTGAIKGRKNLYSYLASAIRNAEKNVLIVTTEQELAGIFESLKNALNKAKNNGIKIKIAAPITKSNSEVAKVLSKYGQVRNIEGLKARFCIVDGKSVSLMALDEGVHESNDFAVLVNTPFFAKGFESIFSTVWEDAKAVEKV